MIEEAIISQVRADTGVAALIAARIYPAYKLQRNNIYPLATYEIDNASSEMASDGPTGLKSADITFACASPLSEDAALVGAAIELALDGKSGMWNGVRVQGVFLKEDGIHDSVQTEEESEDVIAYVKSVSFEIRYNL